MTNTKFRKKALLASVAMLLVAMLALGSATFAWFTTNKTVNASGVKLQTQTGSGLLILSDSEFKVLQNGDTTKTVANFATSYTTAATLNASNADVVLQPANLYINNGAGTFFNVTADEESSYLADNDAVAANVTNQAGYFYHEKVYFKLSDGADDNLDVFLNGITISTTHDDNGSQVANAAAALAPAVRVAIVDSTGAFVAQYANAASAVTENNITAAAAYGTSGTTASITIPVLPTAKGNTSLSKAHKAAVASDYVEIYVFLDGEDSNMSTANARTYNLQDIITSVTVNFSL